MRAAFIPALPPSALLAGMIAPSFRLVNRFCGKSYCARAAAVSGRPRCARYFLGRRSLMCCFARAAAMSGRPRCARYGLGRRSLAGGSRYPPLRSLWHGPSLRRTQAARALRAPVVASKKRASPHPAAVPAGPCFLSQSAKAPLHAPAPAAVGASPRPPLAPWVRASPPPLRASVSSVQRREGKRCALWALRSPKAQSSHPEARAAKP